MSEVRRSHTAQTTFPSALPGIGAPYAYQTLVTEALLSGRRVVLRAPAGSGKTAAAWLPWLATRQQAYDFPTKLLHVLPGGTFFADLHRQLAAHARTLDGVRVAIQTEGDAFDPFFLAQACITSTDHLLSVALHRPLGLHPGLANISAGALLGAYLVFDDFPAFTSRDALIVWLGLLRQYYPATPCIFTTAVWPRALAAHIANILDAELIDAGTVETGGQRLWSHARTLSPERILRHHRKRTIVVCNTVRGAQMLYRALRQLTAVEGRERGPLLLWHQHQFTRDRWAVANHAAAIFGPQGLGSGLLITTPGIEIGSDLSAETLITDYAPPDALARRAGRCARFAGEQGHVIVAQVSEPIPADTYPAPTPEAFLALLGDRPATSTTELAALDAVWSEDTDHQPAVLGALPTLAEIDAAPRQVLTGDETFPRHLFSRVGVCLHRMPETVQDPFELERFSLAIPSLERGWRQWQTSGCPGEWFALVPRWPVSGLHTPTWSLVQDPGEFRAAARLIVLNAEAVSYHPILGLELSPGTAYQSEHLPQQHTVWSPFDQHVQPYTEHAMRALAAFEQLAPDFRFLLRHLGARWHMPTAALEQWLRLCILWHDAGKLTAGWQHAAHRWQAERVRRPAPDGVLARVDFQQQRDGAYPCPEHALASGLVLARALAIVLGESGPLLRGTIAALSHHHGRPPKQEADLTPHPEAWAVLLDLAARIIDTRQLRRVDRTGWTLSLRGVPTVPLTPPSDPEAWMAYSLLARAIRLADREVTLGEFLT